MYAVIRASGKQLRVRPGSVVKMDRLDAEPGQTVTFTDVLMVGTDQGVTIGAPTVPGAAVSATVLENRKDEKILVFKKRRRKNSRRLRGHRQPITILRIGDITA
ncbi:MAG: 50S ribosomal protein L21 [Elioraea sp.]|nr:50S ribosomal protein L21 [Elioraea sp.]MDW8443095.1 50S ribosomal protein L21 [Acetobacteraceae bacterium]